MCNMMDGLVPVSSLLLIRLLPCRVTSGSECVTGVAAATISWRRRWHRRVAATARLWCSRCTISRSCSPPLPTRCGARFSLLLLPLLLKTGDKLRFRREVGNKSEKRTLLADTFSNVDHSCVFPHIVVSKSGKRHKVTFVSLSKLC